MSAEHGLNWDALQRSAPMQGSDFRAPAAQDSDADADADLAPEVVTSSRLGASRSFNCTPKYRLHLGKFPKEYHDVAAMAEPVFKEFLAEFKEAHPKFTHTYKNMTAAHLAFHEFSSALWVFDVKICGLPAKLKAEKEKQLHEAALARGEVPPAEAAAAEPANNKVKVGAAMAAADALCPAGVQLRAPPPAPAANAPAAPINLAAGAAL